MSDKTQKELLVSIIEMQTKQSNDITEIKTCLLGDEYHKEGYVQKVDKNTECIRKLKRRQTGFFAMIGGAWTIFTLGIAYLISKN